MKILVDANNIAYRAKSTQNLTTKSGEQVGTIYGTLNSIQAFLKKSAGGWKNHMLNAIHDHLGDKTEEIESIIMCWDGGKSKFRKALYPDYKGHREKKRSERSEEDQAAYFSFLDQMETLHTILPDFGVHSLKIRGWEGDDLIYSARQVIDPSEICIVVSTDRDMLQLVDETTFVWVPSREQLVTPANFAKVTGVSKENYLTYRVLVGDTSDNIDGIYGIGDKKAKDLIIKYGNLEGIRANHQALMKSVVTKRIFEDAGRVTLDRNMKLMDLKRIPIKEIEGYVKSAVEAEVAYNPPVVRLFLMSKQFVSILKDVNTWNLMFEKLK